MRRVGAVAVLAWTVALLVPAAAPGEPAGRSTTTAVSLKEATAIALRTLRPGRGTIVFALPQPVGARQRVGEGVSGPVRAAGARSWLFWQDESPFAQFRHPSRLLLVDAATGEVRRLQRMRWWPVLDGRLLPFSPGRSGYRSARFRVHPVGRSPSSRGPSASVGLGAAIGRTALPAGAFAADCLVTIGAEEDPMFAPSFDAMRAWAKARGIRSFATSSKADGTAQEGPPTTGDLGVTIGKAIKAKCTDVLVYLAGHGGEPPSGDPFGDGGSFAGDYSKLGEGSLPYVSSVSGGAITVGPDGAADPQITSRDLRELIVAFGKQDVTFKVLVDSCFSGRFANDLRKATPSNLLILGTSTSATTVSYGEIAPLQGYGQLRPFDHVYYRNGKRMTRFVRVEIPKRPITGVGEFTTGVLGGWTAFERSDAQVDEAVSTAGSTGIPLLVLGLRDALGASSRFDLAAKNDLTKPQIVFPRNVAVEPPKQVSAVLTLQGTGAVLAVTNPTGATPIQFLRYTLPQGVRATGIGTPPPGCQVGAPTPPPSAVLIARCSPAIQPGTTVRIPFTTNGVAGPPGDAGTLFGSATGEPGSDFPIAVTRR